MLSETITALGEGEGMVSEVVLTSRSAMARPVSMALVGERISRRVNTIIFKLFAMLPNVHTSMLT